MGAYQELPRERRVPSRAAPVERLPTERSHAAIPVAVILLGVGLYFASYSILIPAALGLLLFSSGCSLLSSRLNPLSAHYYSPRKASWAAIGVVFLGALVLFAWVYELWLRGGAAALLPHP